MSSPCELIAFDSSSILLSPFVLQRECAAASAELRREFRGDKTSGAIAPRAVGETQYTSERVEGQMVPPRKIVTLRPGARAAFASADP
jgi:hypothetical protein